MTQFKFNIGDVCTFTNCGSSGVTSNDGKKCKIMQLKDPESEDWKGVLRKPGYVIEFLDGSNNFGCCESELELKSTT